MQWDPVWALPRGLETFGVVLGLQAGTSLDCPFGGFVAVLR